MKHLKEQDLIDMGIEAWGTRITLLEAIYKYYNATPWYPNE